MLLGLELLHLCIGGGKKISVKWRMHGLTLPVPFCAPGPGEQEADSCPRRYGGNCNVDFFLFIFFLSL